MSSDDPHGPREWHWDRPPDPPSWHGQRPPDAPPSRTHCTGRLFGHWRRPVSTWNTTDWNNAAIAITVVLALLVCSISGMVLALSSHVTRCTVPVHTLSTTTAVSTATPRTAQIINGPYLGGTQDAFTDALGQPADFSGQLSYHVTTSDGFSGQVCFCTAQTGSDGRQRLAILSINVLHLDPSLYPNVIRLFFPPDAQHVADLTDPEIGPIHIYQSASLALTFPAADFTNSTGGGLVPPGTFGMACEPPSQACTIAIGE